MKNIYIGVVIFFIGSFFNTVSAISYEVLPWVKVNVEMNEIQAQSVGSRFQGNIFTKYQCKKNVNCNMMYYPLLSHINKNTDFNNEELILEDIFNSQIAKAPEGRFVRGIRVKKMDCYFIFTHTSTPDQEDFGYANAFCLKKASILGNKFIGVQQQLNIPITKSDFLNVITYLDKKSGVRPEGESQKILISLINQSREALIFYIRDKRSK